jgi:carbon starvation protein
MITLVSVTFTAALEKLFSPSPRMGFLAHAQHLASQAASGQSVARAAQLIMNDRLDAAVTGVLIVLVALVLVESSREWYRVLSGRKAYAVTEAPYVPSRFAVEEV